MPDVEGVYYAQYIENDFVFPHDIITAHGLVECRFLTFRQAVFVVELPRTIEAQPDRKILLLEKTAPIVIEQSGVCLNSVENAFSGGFIFVLNINDIPEIVQTEQSRFAAVPGKPYFIFGAGVDMLADIFFEDIFLHAERRGTRIEILLFQVIAVVAVEVADRADRFGKYLKIAGCFNHVYIALPPRLLADKHRAEK